MKEQELAEKRRVAPGWLDREEKILEPKRGSGGGGGGGGAAGAMSSGGVRVQSANIMDQQDGQDESRAAAGADPAGDELDRAFGGMGLRNG